MPCGCRKVNSQSVGSFEQQKSPMPWSLLDRHTVPHGGFRFREERTRTNLTAPTLWYLAEAVIKHRRQNGLDASDMDSTMREIEDQLCSGAPPNTCRDVEGKVKMTGTALTFDTITRGAETLFDFFVKNGRKKVALEQATERARVCGNCFANQKPEGCTSCASGWLRGLAEKIVGGDETPHDPLIHSCSFCGCQLRSLIWMPIEVLRDHTPAGELESLPDFCWKRKEINGSSK
jgi:hypothetical protein